MSVDPRLNMWQQETSIYYEKPLHMLSKGDKDNVIRRHLISKQECESYLQRLQVYEKENLKYVINRMLALCDVENDELCILILTEFHKHRQNKRR